MDVKGPISVIYDACNRRDPDALLTALAPDVDWPNGWQGGRIHGRDAVRAYWVRQWTETDPQLTLVATGERSDGTVEALVHTVVRDAEGTLLDEHDLRHVYRFSDGLVVRMDIER